jgi:hypothetical protein
MGTTSRKKAHNSGILVDGDRLGFIAAILVGTLVMVLGLFYFQLDGFAVAIRVGVTAVVAYAAVFLFVHFVLQTVMTEIAVERLSHKLDQQVGDASPEGGRGPEISGDIK